MRMRTTEPVVAAAAGTKMQEPAGDGPGLAIEDGVIGQVEVSQLRDTLGDLQARSRAGARHLMSHPAVQELANDPRLLSLAQGHLGRGAVPYRATLFDKSGPPIGWSSGTKTPRCRCGSVATSTAGARGPSKLASSTRTPRRASSSASLPCESTWTIPIQRTVHFECFPEPTAEECCPIRRSRTWPPRLGRRNASWGLAVSS